MTSSLDLIVTEPAQDDILATLRHSMMIWGESQAEVYAYRLNTALRELADFPLLGVARDDLSPGLRSLQVGQHVILYRADERNVVIIRVLHKRMDLATHLRD